jgi:hypothetical protein
LEESEFEFGGAGGMKKTVLQNKIPPLIATKLSKKTSKNM